MSPRNRRRLEGRQLAFALAYAGRGTGVRAAEAAGYTGNPATLRKRAWELLRTPEVVARIEARGVTIERGRLERGPRVLGRGDLERIAIAMEIARDPAVAARDRIKAARTAAHLAGDFDRRPPLWRLR